MNEILLRLKMKSPLFFRRVSRVCAALFAVSVFLKAQETDIMVWGVSLVTLGLGANAFGILVAQLTVRDRRVLDELLDKQAGEQPPI